MSFLTVRLRPQPAPSPLRFVLALAMVEDAREAIR